MPANTPHAAPVARGCGKSRTVDGVYLEVGTSPFGRPFEDFLKCPPVVLPPGLNAETLANKNLLWEDPATHVTHILIWIGASHYPYLPDYLEESRRHGISRRISSQTDFAQLTSASRLLLVHPLAFNTAWAEQTPPELCGVGIPGHALLGSDADTPPTGPCLYKLWDLIPPAAGRRVEDDADTRGIATYARLIGETRYTYHPTGEPEGDYLPAVFGVFALTNIALIAGPDGELGPKTSQVKEKLDALGGLPYSIETA